VAFHYTDPKRENDDPHALPDVEIFLSDVGECGCDSGPVLMCPESLGGGGFVQCECGDTFRASEVNVWFYAYGLPGCLWDSDPIGPFDTEAEALADARGEQGTAAS